MNKQPRGLSAGKGVRDIDKGTLSRVVKLLFKSYPVLAPLTLFCIVFSAFVSAMPAIFQEKVIAIIDEFTKAGNRNYSEALEKLLPLIGILIGIYVVSIIFITLFHQSMAYMTQGFLSKLRIKMFEGMQNLPIRYFDSTKHGNIMSHYTNDIDTLRQLISQSMPSLIQSSIILFSVIAIMLWYSVWMFLVVLVGVTAMLLVTKKIGGGSAKYFVRQQQSVAKTEGFVQEMMNGQKVIKVFCREDEVNADFDKVNGELFENAFHAHAYANMLGPIISNIGNVLYVLCAVVGGVFLASEITNLSISGMVFGINILVPFLNMTKQFTGNLNQFSQQINSIAMGLAGAKRVFDLMDQQSEVDDGYVTLVNAKKLDDGTIVESEERTGLWAWKHPHGDGTLTYTELRGDVRLLDVDFGYGSVAFCDVGGHCGNVRAIYGV